MSLFIKYLDKIINRYEPKGSKFLWWEVQKKYTADTVDFIYKEMPSAMFFENPLDILEYVMSIRVQGSILEFGVFSGTTINHMADFAPNEKIFGFDSFEGLPEPWKGFLYIPRMFDRKGTMPEVRSNVTLIKGWFDKTVPEFFEKHKEPISVLHIDSDLYSSAKIVLDHSKSFLKKGSIIVFDEFFNYPGYKLHEFKAFFEFIESTSFKYEFLAYSGNQAAVRLL